MNITKSKLNKEFISILYQYYPQTKELANFLMDALDLSRESAYRRLRGEVSFTFEEIAEIAYILKISLDKLIGLHTNMVHLDMELCCGSKPEEIYNKILRTNLGTSSSLLHADDTLIYLILNRLPYGLTMSSERLSKFYFYKWMFHRQKGSMKETFDKFTVPDILKETFADLVRTCTASNGEMHLILDENIFIYMIREIDYFRKRDLINDEDMQAMKNDLLDILELLSRVARTGANNGQGSIRMYLSAVDLEPSYSYTEVNGNPAFHIWSPAGEIVSSTNPEFCARQKEWIESLVRYTTLITKCNEMEQMKFFETQREHILSMSDACISPCARKEGTY